MPLTCWSSIEALNHDIVRCAKCPRLVAFREEVALQKRRMYRDWEYWGRPLPGFGDPAARVLILGLAPAAHGANRTGRMFTGDSSADFLMSGLHRSGFSNQATSRRPDDGLALRDAYITAAVRCAPPGNKPTAGELANCRSYLLAELGLLPNVRVVLGLGKIAFDSYLAALVALGKPLPGPRAGFGHGVAYRLSDGKTLVGCYHPSRQNTQTGRLTAPMFEAVFQKVRSLLEHGPSAARAGSLFTESRKPSE